MCNLFQIVITLMLSAGFAFNSLSYDDQFAIAKPFIYALINNDLRETDLAIEKAEDQFFDHKMVFEKSATMLDPLQGISIVLDPSDAGRRKVRNSIELSGGRVLYVAADRKLSEDEMALTISPEVADVFNKTDCIEMDIESAYIIYWWEMPGHFIGGGVINLKNQDRLESWIKIRRNLTENWVSFLYSSI